MGWTRAMHEKKDSGEGIIDIKPLKSNAWHGLKQLWKEQAHSARLDCARPWIWTGTQERMLSLWCGQYQDHWPACSSHLLDTRSEPVLLEVDYDTLEPVQLGFSGSAASASQRRMTIAAHGKREIWNRVSSFSLLSSGRYYFHPCALMQNC